MRCNATLNEFEQQLPARHPAFAHYSLSNHPELPELVEWLSALERH